MHKIIFLLLSISTCAFADIGTVIHDTPGFVRPIFQGGHAGIYISNACIDNNETSSPKLRLCTDDDVNKGVVLGKYMKLSKYQKFDFLPVSFNGYFYGSETKEKAPLFVNPEILNLLRERTYRNEFSHAVQRNGEEQGRWKMTIASGTRRSNYIYVMPTTAEEDLQLIRAINEHNHTGKFNLLTNNCSHMVKNTIAHLFPEIIETDSKIDLFTTTPKGIAKALKMIAEKHERSTHIIQVAQLPGTFFLSGPVSDAKEILAEVGIAAGGFVVMGPLGIIPAAIGYTLINLKDPHRQYLSSELTEYFNALDAKNKTWTKLRMTEARTKNLPLDIRNKQVAEARVNHEIAKIRFNEVSKIVYGDKDYFKEVKQRIKQMTSDLLKIKVLNASEADIANKNGKSLIRYLSKNASFSLSDKGAIIMRLSDNDITEISSEGVISGEPKASFLAALARVQYWLGFTVRNSERHKVELKDFEEDLALLETVFQKITAQNGGNL